MAASDQINKTLTKEIRNLKLNQYIPFSVKLNASRTEHKRWLRWFFYTSAGYSSEAAPEQSQPMFLFFFYFFFFFFSIRVFFHGHWRLIGQQGKGGDHLLFHPTISTRSRTFRHLFATLQGKRKLFQRYFRMVCMSHSFFQA